MKYAKISFSSREEAVRAYQELVTRGRVVSLPEGQFIVPEPAIRFLEATGTIFQVHEWLHSDHVNKSLPENSVGLLFSGKRADGEARGTRMPVAASD